MKIQEFEKKVVEENDRNLEFSNEQDFDRRQSSQIFGLNALNHQKSIFRYNQQQEMPKLGISKVSKELTNLEKNKNFIEKYLRSVGINGGSITRQAFPSSLPSVKHSNSKSLVRGGLQQLNQPSNAAVNMSPSQWAASGGNIGSYVSKQRGSTSPRALINNQLSKTLEMGGRLAT